MRKIDRVVSAAIASDTFNVSALIVTAELIPAAASSVVKLDISPKSVVRETTWGRLCWAADVPVPNKPQQSQCSYGGSCKVEGNGHHREVWRCCSRTNAGFRVVRVTSAE